MIELDKDGNFLSHIEPYFMFAFLSLPQVKVQGIYCQILNCAAEINL